MLSAKGLAVPLLSAALAAFCSISAVRAEVYPNRPVRIVLGFAPGGGLDILGRTIAQKLTERFGTSVSSITVRAPAA
jgi:tripartite-type tricarboxylate transporter receptor subunit TctC